MNILHKSLVIISFSILMFSCKREHKDGSVVGQTNIAASSKFDIVSPFVMINPSPFVDLNNTSPNFSAEFNETVSWKIILTGLNSTAVKVLSGTSSVIDVTNSIWIGNHDGLYYFEDGDSIKADLLIAGKEGIYRTTSFKLGNARALITTSTFQLAQPNSSYPSSFEGNIMFPYLFNVGATTTITLQDSIIRAPEGTHYMHIEGVSVDPNGFFVGGIQCRMDQTADTIAPRFMPVTWTDPSKIYVNVYVRGMDHLPAGNVPYAYLNFECHEDDNLNFSTPANCSYYASKPQGTATDYFCPSSEDAWVYKMAINHIGWKLFSCRYIDMMPSEDFANGGFGNKKMEPQKVCRVQFGLVSNPAHNRVSVDIDFACFTYGAPLDPTK